MALKSKNQKCQDCHAKTVAAPMKTTAKLAFHDAMAKKGTCIDCHVKEAAAGKKAPLKCNECHTVKG
jgi:nitrate/TMAO reductase-like tetraheme cytochrome c subunit